MALAKKNLLGLTDEGSLVLDPVVGTGTWSEANLAPAPTRAGACVSTRSSTPAPPPGVLGGRMHNAAYPKSGSHSINKGGSDTQTQCH